MVCRLATLAAWAGFLVAYPVLEVQFGQFAVLAGLVPAALTGWVWGAWNGLIGGAFAYTVLQFRMTLQPGGDSHLLETPMIGHVLGLLAYAGVGVAVGRLWELTLTLRQARTLSERAQMDALTGVLSRGAFEEQLEEKVGRAAARRERLALLFVDLDRFKFVNDTYGHDKGDKLLQEVGNVLRANVRAGDLVGRVGGDEFTVALLGIKEDASAGQVARSLVRELSAPFHIDGRELQVSASVGVSIFPRDGGSAEQLFHSADAAMYEAKQGGKNSYQFSSVAARSRQTRRLELERVLRRALADNQFEVVYQPQVRLEDASLIGFEALLRWRSPEFGLVSPTEFIPVAEEAGLISSIGHWTLRESALQQQAWMRQGLLPVRVSVNVSTLQFHQSGFLETVRGALNDSGLSPSQLEIELTESVLVRDERLALKTLFKLSKLGVGIALDDFGTGYSSLAYLRSLPISTLKIDRSFVKELSPETADLANRDVFATMTEHDLKQTMAGRRLSNVARRSLHAEPIVEAIAAMAHKLGKDVIAEGVETAYQRDYLRRLGLGYAQGYFFARPMSPIDAEALLRKLTHESKYPTGEKPKDGQITYRPLVRRRPTLEELVEPKRTSVELITGANAVPGTTSELDEAGADEHGGDELRISGLWRSAVEEPVVYGAPPPVETGANDGNQLDEVLIWEN